MDFLESIVLQTMHSKIAGDLARALLPQPFGPLPDEVLLAVSEHDLGWAQSDDQQIANILEEDPQPFPRVHPLVELQSWQRSVSCAFEKPLLTQVLIGRHLCAIAQRPTPLHAEFLQSASGRREEIEQQLCVAPEELRRWTDALGFCDLVSLYLCSGVTAPAEFPLAHPAETYAAQARTTVATWNDGTLRFSETLFQPGLLITGEILAFDPTERVLAPRPIEWSIA